jgi:hypothetical protein
VMNSHPILGGVSVWVLGRLEFSFYVLWFCARVK